MNKLFCSICILSSLIGCQTNKKEPVTIFCKNAAPSVSITKVSLKEKEKIKSLDGKFVQIEGYFHDNFEDVAVYATRSSSPKEAIWLEMRIPDSIKAEQISALNNKKIIVVGKIDTSDKGHFGSYQGTLKMVICLKVP